jgi:hypothetical protein
VLLIQDVSPEQPCERRAEGCAESSVVNTDGHAIHCCPECPIRDGDAVVCMDLLPGLDDTGEQDGGADVGARKLLCISQSSLLPPTMLGNFADKVLTLHNITEMKPIPPIAPTVPVLSTQ